MIVIMSDAISLFFSQHPTRRAPAGTVLFLTGDTVSTVYFVRDGALALRRTTETGVEMILQTARSGDVLAEASAYSDTYHCDGLVLQDATYAAVARQKFREALKTDQALREAWDKRLARGIQSARSKAEIRGLKTVRERLEMWLALYGPLPAKGQWHALAAEIGVSSEALYRELKRRT